MRIFALAVLLIAMTVMAVSVSGCYMRTRHGEVVGVGLVVTHDERWHYDNDYDDNWRHHHPWRPGYHYHYR